MPFQPQDSPLGAFLKALREEKIDSIRVGAMAAIEQGAPLMTVDYDFWVNLPERQYVRLLAIVRRQGGNHPRAGHAAQSRRGGEGVAEGGRSLHNPSKHVWTLMS